MEVKVVEERLRLALLSGNLTTILVYKLKNENEAPYEMTKHVGIISSYTIAEKYIYIWFSNRFERVNIPVTDAINVSVY